MAHDAVLRFTDIDEMLALPDLDVVVVATPNRMHAEHGVKVLAAGKWLLIEKPLAESQREFDQVENAISEYDGKCTLALHAAFGVELEWYVANQESVSGVASQISAFRSGFYDPYFENGQIIADGLSLGGSWMDSGINALSVICRLVSPGDLLIRDSRMTRVAGSECLEVQGTVEFHLNSDVAPLFGVIDTNWTIGRDSKATTLSYHGSEDRIILDHSAEEVIRVSPGEREHTVQERERASETDQSLRRRLS